MTRTPPSTDPATGPDSTSRVGFDALGVTPGLCRALAAMGCRRPRPIQTAAIPPFSEGRDLIGLAPTGTGKTIAFLVPMISRIRAARHVSTEPGRVHRLRGLVLCPTRELTVQVAAVARPLANHSGLSARGVHGKVGLAADVAMLREGLDLLVATPGRVRELRAAGGIDLSRVGVLTVDEGDRMLDLGFLPQIARIIEALPSGRQIAMFSATMPEPVEALARQFMTDPERVEIGTHTRAAAHVEQELVRVEDRDKVDLLIDWLKTGKVEPGVLVFCRTRRRVGWVGTALARQGIRTGVLHGDRSQAQRRRALERFESKDLDVLVATDVAARGLHLERVRTVVNYDVPREPEEFVHRVGRAGHGGTAGRAITLLSGPDRMLWKDIAHGTDVGIAAHTASLPKGDDADPGHAGRGAAARQQREREEKAKFKGGRGRMRGRSRRSKPIDPKQKPGGGVVRIERPEEG